MKLTLGTLAKLSQGGNELRALGLGISMEQTLQKLQEIVKQPELAQRCHHALFMLVTYVGTLDRTEVTLATEECK